MYIYICIDTMGSMGICRVLSSHVSVGEGRRLEELHGFTCANGRER